MSKHYAVTYRHNGKRLSLWLCAESEFDAVEQLKAALGGGRPGAVVQVEEVVSTIHLAGFSRRLDVLGWCLFLAAMAVVFWR